MRAGSGACLKTCPKCMKLVEKLGPIGPARFGRAVVPGPKSAVGWRVVGTERTVSFKIQDVACGPCGGKIETESAPIWREAREAWSAVTDPALLRFAPKRR